MLVEGEQLGDEDVVEVHHPDLHRLDALLHYAPIEATLEGEPREIWVFLGSDRLAAPILEHGPDLVLHGHAHAGSPDGTIGETPVHNVAQPLLGADFRIFDLEVSRAQSPIR